MKRVVFRPLQKEAIDKAPTSLQDVFFDSAKRVLSLRSKLWIIIIDPKRIHHFFHEHKILLAIVVLLLIIGGILGSSSRTKALVAYFYPESCLGGWENPSNAEGLPDVSSKSELSAYHRGNSAHLKNATAELYCGSFAGEIPADTVPISFKLGFSWSIDNGSVIHEEPGEFEIVPESIETEEVIDIPEINTPTTEEENLEEAPLSPEEIPPEEVNEAVEDVPEDPNDGSEEPAPLEEAEEESEGSSDGGGETLETVLHLLARKVFAEEISESAEVPVEEPPQEEPVEEPQVEEAQEPEEQAINEDEMSEEVTEEQTPQTLETSTESPLIEESLLVEPDGEIRVEREIEGKQETETPDLSSVGSTTAPETIETPDVLEVLFTLDGTTWEVLGTVSHTTWDQRTFSIPITDWTDLHQVQVALKPIASIDEPPVIYVDSIYIEVEYEAMATDAEIQPDFYTDTVLFDETTDSIRVVKIIKDGIVQIWYADLSEPSLTPSLPLDLPEDKDKEKDKNKESEVAKEPGVKLDEIEEIIITPEVIDETIVIEEVEDGVEGESQGEVPDGEVPNGEVQNEEILGEGTPDIEEGENSPETPAPEDLPPPDAEVLVFGVSTTIPEAEPMSIEGEPLADIAPETPISIISHNVRLALAGTSTSSPNLTSQEKEEASKLHWYFVSEGSFVDEQGPVVYEHRTLYWLGPEQTFVYSFQIDEKLLLSEYYVAPAILDFRKNDKIDTFDPEAEHSCVVEPFSQVVSGDTAHFSVLLTQHERGVHYELETGGLPLGTSVAFSKPTSSKGADKVISVPGTLTQTEPLAGSYTIMIIVKEKYRSKEELVRNFCQLNLIF